MPQGQRGGLAFSLAFKRVSPIFGSLNVWAPPRIIFFVPLVGLFGLDLWSNKLGDIFIKASFSDETSLVFLFLASLVDFIQFRQQVWSKAKQKRIISRSDREHISYLSHMRRHL